jgi:hypothetical protein
MAEALVVLQREHADPFRDFPASYLAWQILPTIERQAGGDKADLRKRRRAGVVAAVELLS